MLRFLIRSYTSAASVQAIPNNIRTEVLKIMLRLIIALLMIIVLLFLLQI